MKISFTRTSLKEENYDYIFLYLGYFIGKLLFGAIAKYCE
jgi:hypothetical protein